MIDVEQAANAAAQAADLLTTAHFHLAELEDTITRLADQAGFDGQTRMDFAADLRRLDARLANVGVGA